MGDTRYDMQAYYRTRAPVYDRVYTYPERQADLRKLKQRLPELLRGKDVLEVAAGTGYWTEVISQTAASIFATDGAHETLAFIPHRTLGCSVKTQEIDAYALSDIQANACTTKFNAAFAGLWFSHIPIHRREAWRDELHRCLQPGARVVLLDNSRAQCERLPITRTDDDGNTYQTRRTDDGNTYEVLKNFPIPAELTALIAGHGSDGDFAMFEHFWLYHYKIG